MIDSIDKNFIQIETDANNKEELIKEISVMAKRSSILEQISASEIEEALLQREETMSTGLNEGIAIPHCSFEGLKDFVVGLIISREGVEFESIDHQLSHCIFFIIGPQKERNRHIKILSSISKLSKDKKSLAQMLNSDSSESVLKLLKRDEKIETEEENREKVQFTLHIQKEELFFDVLEILSSEVEGSVSVLDSSTAGSYLHRLPLFSTFWNEKVSHFSKIIIAVIDKKLVNDTIRRINMVLPQDKKGIIISVCDIFYFDGSIDF